MVMFAFLSIHTIQASETYSISDAGNSQSLALLSPTFTIEVPDAIGGPVYIGDNTYTNVLVANNGIFNNDILSESFEDTNGISIYIVRKGDTLSTIAELFNVSINTIKWENKLGKTLKIGQELRILPVTGVSHTIKKGETFDKIALNYSVDVKNIMIFNDLDAKSLKIGKKIIVPNGIKKSIAKNKLSSSRKSKVKISGNAQLEYYIRPTTGRVSSWYGMRSRGYHYGIDIANSTGTPIVAAASGKVLKTTCGRGYGICTILEHSNGTRTLYAHTSKLFVKTGDSVKQGQKIANLGNTGRSTGPHLHFEIQDARTGAKKNPNHLYK